MNGGGIDWYHPLPGVLLYSQCGKVTHSKLEIVEMTSYNYTLECTI
jgi:hypothetical protein